MLLTIGIIIALASTFIEMGAVWAFPPLEKLYTNGLGPIPGIWFNFVFSLLLSYVLGFLFGAQGVTVFVGGVGSTMLGAMIMKAKHALNSAGITWKGLKSGASNTNTWWINNKDSIIKTTQDLITTGKVLIKIILIPVHICQRILHILAVMAQGANTTVNKIDNLVTKAKGASS